MNARCEVVMQQALWVQRLRDKELAAERALADVRDKRRAAEERLDALLRGEEPIADVCAFTPDPDAKTLHARLKNFALQQRAEFSNVDIMNALDLGIKNRSATRQALKRLVDDGTLVRVSNGRFRTARAPTA